MTVLGAILHMGTIKGLTWNKFKIKGRPKKKKLGRRLEEFNEQKLTCIKSDLVLTWQMLSGCKPDMCLEISRGMLHFE